MDIEDELFAILQAELFQPSTQAIHQRRKHFAQVDDPDTLRLCRLSLNRTPNKLPESQ